MPGRDPRASACRGDNLDALLESVSILGGKP
jgi:hypothetical protein